VQPSLLQKKEKPFMVRAVDSQKAPINKHSLQAGLPYNPITLHFHSHAQESQFRQQWTIRRAVYDRNTLAVSLSCIALASLYQLVLMALHNNKMGIDDEESCPGLSASSLLGAGSHLLLILVMGSAFIRHRTPIVAFFRMYSALTTAGPPARMCSGFFDCQDGQASGDPSLKPDV
jgi:hypothetical protein